MKYLLIAGFLFIPVTVAQAAEIGHVQTKATEVAVNSTGQVRNNFVVVFDDGTSFGFVSNQHIWVVSKVMENETQTGWICSHQNRQFFVDRNNVQI